MKELLQKRRTIRKFKQQPLTKDQLSEYIDAARLAPSAANMQPLKYVAIASKEMADAMFPLVKWAGYLAPDYDPTEGERPTAYVAVCINTRIRQGGCDMDIGAAVENLILAALSDGVGACWMGSIDRPKIGELLHLPEYLTLSCVVALGYPEEDPKEVAVREDNIRYYLDETDTLCVPKRALTDVLIEIV